MTFDRDQSLLSDSLWPGRTILLAFNDIFFFLLGGSAWILINGIYAQIPFIILMSDGNYGVVSKITLCVTLSSLLPILLSISFFESFPRSPLVPSSKIKSVTNINSSKRTTRGPTSIHTFDNQNWYINIGIAFVLSIGLVTSFVLTIWTEGVISQLGSLMATVTAGGIVGTTSSVLYYPHAATTAKTTPLEFESSGNASNVALNVAKRQTTAMMFGTATSNLFVAILAIFQQQKLEQQPEDRLESITVRNYFAILMIVMGLSATGFVGTLLIRRTMEDNAASDSRKYNAYDHTSFSEQSSLMEAQSIKGRSTKLLDQNHRQSYPARESFNESLSFWEMTYLNSTLNASQFILNAMTFFLPGIVPYSVRNEYDEKNKSSDALQYLIVFQLVAQTLGVLASSCGGSSGSSCETTKSNVKRQVGSFFLFLWIPMVFLSFNNRKKFGVVIPIFFNTTLNFASAYCNTSWFHFSVHHHHPIGRTKEDTKANEAIYLENGKYVSTTSVTRIMATWHQIGATVGSAIAFAIIQSAAIVPN